MASKIKKVKFPFKYKSWRGEDIFVNREILYDSTAPCVICGLPVIEASWGGTAICPWCDLGIYRNGSRHHTLEPKLIKKRAEEINNGLMDSKQDTHVYLVRFICGKKLKS